MAIKENINEDLIFADRNGSTLEVYNDDFSTHDLTVEVDNNYNNYNSNNTAYKDSTNNEEDSATYEDSASANTTH